MRTEAIEADQETNEPSLAVERAVGSLDLKEKLLSDDPIYRSRVADAIRSLEAVMDLWVGNDQAVGHECPQAVPL